MEQATPTQNTDFPLVYMKLAGILYLIIIVAGIYSEVFVRSSLYVVDNPAVTISNILTSMQLFRSGIFADSLMLLSDVAIAVLFYQIFKVVNKPLAQIAAAFRLTQAAILGLNLLFLVAVMLLLEGQAGYSHWEKETLNMITMLLFTMHSYGYDLGLLFFAISNIILGYLMISSVNFPSLLGYAIQLAGVVYLLGGYVRMLLPEVYPYFEAYYLIPFIAELGFALWLIVKGNTQMGTGEIND